MLCRLHCMMVFPSSSTHTGISKLAHCMGTVHRDGLGTVHRDGLGTVHRDGLGTNGYQIYRLYRHCTALKFYLPRIAGCVAVCFPARCVCLW